MNAPSVDAVPDRALADYEALRRAVLEGTRGDGDLGLALFIRRGMAAWLRAWTACATPPRSGDAIPAGPRPVLPADIRGDVARLLITMALTATHTEAHA